VSVVIESAFDLPNHPLQLVPQMRFVLFAAPYRTAPDNGVCWRLGDSFAKACRRNPVRGAPNRGGACPWL